MYQHIHIVIALTLLFVTWHIFLKYWLIIPEEVKYWDDKLDDYMNR